MLLIGNDESSAQIQVSTEELLLINNALNEVCNGFAIGDAEFQTRLGLERSQARELLGQIGTLYDALFQFTKRD